MSTTDGIKTQETPQDNPPELREFLKLRYMGDCKCGECHLVPARAVKHYADLVDAQAKRIEQLEEARRVDTLTTSHYVANVAIKQLWDMLGATNQTEAVLKLRELVAPSWKCRAPGAPVCTAQCNACAAMEETGPE